MTIEGWLLSNRELFDIYECHDFSGIKVYIVAAYNNDEFAHFFNDDYVGDKTAECKIVNNLAVIVEI